MRLFMDTIGGAICGAIVCWLFLDQCGLGAALLKGITLIFGSAPMQLQGNFYAVGAVIGAACGFLAYFMPRRRRRREGPQDQA